MIKKLGTTNMEELNNLNEVLRMEKRFKTIHLSALEITEVMEVLSWDSPHYISFDKLRQGKIDEVWYRFTKIRFKKEAECQKSNGT